MYDKIKAVQEGSIITARLELTNFEVYRVYSQQIGDYAVLFHQARSGFPKPFDVVPTQNRNEAEVNNDINLRLNAKINNFVEDENTRRSVA